MHKYQDTNYTFEERADDLLQRMTLEEKISQLVHSSKAIPRLDIPRYNWWSEGLHGVSRAGLATVFPQAIGLAASWNVDLMHEIATAISDEGRAKHHDALRHGLHKIYMGLTFWTPTINIVRDPRWGRTQETYGECPYLTARMAVAYVKGTQGDDPRYFKLIATPKHYGAHNGPESKRHVLDAIVSEEDLRETYLPAFEASIKEAGAYSVMGAYSAVNGEPCCASPTLLQDILRDEWGFEGFVVSDCGAITNLHATHHFVDSLPEAVAAALNAGCDMDCGSAYPPHITEAIEQGLTDEATIDRSLRRLLLARFKLGMFDPPEDVPYSNIPYSVVDSPEHQALARRAARESIVLLKNEGLLPLDLSKESIAVIGPVADSEIVLKGNYSGTASDPITLLDGLRREFPDATIQHAAGALLTEGWLNEQALPVEWLQPLSDDGHGLSATYYDNETFSGEPVKTQVDTTTDWHWHRDTDKPTPWGQTFSVRWEGYLTVPETGSYRFAIDGPMRQSFYFEGEQLIDRTFPWPGRDETDFITLEAGRQYHLKMECVAGSAPGTRLQLLIGTPAHDLFAEAKAIAEQADLIIMTLGLTADMENEEMPVEMPGFSGGDRTDIILPATQQALLKSICELGKPMVLVLTGGSAIAVPWADQHIPAILQVWYPGQAGGLALADVLSGAYNPAGRLPVTVYADVEDLPPFEDYAMAGRTYRYFDKTPLYPFGYGLSYTTFSYSDLQIEERTVRVTVTNTGQHAGDEVVQCYLSRENARDIHTLVGFKRIHLGVGEAQIVTFEIATAGNISVGGQQPHSHDDPIVLHGILA